MKTVWAPTLRRDPSQASDSQGWGPRRTASGANSSSQVSPAMPHLPKPHLQFQSVTAEPAPEVNCSPCCCFQIGSRRPHVFAARAAPLQSDRTLGCSLYGVSDVVQYIHVHTDICNTTYTTKKHQPISDLRTKLTFAQSLPCQYLQLCITPCHSQDWLQSGQTHRNTADSQDTATSGGHALPAASLRSAHTWSSGHLRSLASDAATAALNDPAVTRLDIQEGGVSPWKGDQVRHVVSQA